MYCETVLLSYYKTFSHPFITGVAVPFILGPSLLPEPNGTDTSLVSTLGIMTDATEDINYSAGLRLFYILKSF